MADDTYEESNDDYGQKYPKSNVGVEQKLRHVFHRLMCLSRDEFILKHSWNFVSFET